jgi:mono/diheme cytochrome c family protein
VLVLFAPAAAPASEAALRFERDGALVRVIDLAALRAGCNVTLVEVAEDPYYARPKRFRACPLAEVLALGFGAPASHLSGENFFLRARDGYVKPASGERMLEPGGYVAFADADRADSGDSGWEPIDRRQVDPGPFYLVWAGAGQSDLHRYPWPYQLVAIEIAPFESRYPHTVPRGEPKSSAAWQGFEVFSRECIACHAINGEGGTVGPELNLPRSIVEYRPADQIRAFVRDPETFRYTSMPAHRHLSAAQLDALIAYFEAMKTRKHDPRPASVP